MNGYPNREFYRWMSEIALNKQFENVVQLSERKEDEGFRQELVLRFMLQVEFQERVRFVTIHVPSGGGVGW